VHYVYIALMDDGRFYTGQTLRAPADRLADHRSRGRSVIRILWYEPHATASAAGARERQIKGWSHAKKQALIDGDFRKLRFLARSKSRQQRRPS
jgi:predicted GIY-YIG superfamily endonuclease